MNCCKKITHLFFIFLSFFLVTSIFAQQENQKASLPKPLSNKWEGKFEIEVHYSRWSIDLIKGWFEDSLTERLGREIRDEVSSQIRDSHSSLIKSDFEEDLSFDSTGSNYGLEIRFYPQGREGSFSLGVSFEKTNMRLMVKGPVKQEFTDGTYAEVDSEGYIEMSPFSTNLSFRWDMMPKWRATPYFVLGFGLAALDGEVGYEYQGVYQWAGSSEQVENTEVQTLKEAEEDIDFNFPNIFFLLQMNFGLRVELIPYLHLRMEAGFWDGFVLRAGISLRF